MVSFDWYSQLESRIFQKVKKAVQTEVDSSIFCTTNDSNVSGADLPNLYLHELENVEQVTTLVNDTINALLYGVQIEINGVKKTDIKPIMLVAVDTMKSMRFSLIGTPVTLKEGTNLYRCVIRFRRMIAAEDIL